MASRSRQVRNMLSKVWPTGRGVKESSKGWRRLPPTLALICIVLLAAWMGYASGGYFVRNWAPPAFVLAALALLLAAVGLPVGLPKQKNLLWGALALDLFGAYTVWTFASLLWSPNKGDAWLGAGQTLLYLLVFWVVMALIALGASRRWVLAASALGPAAVAAFTLLTFGPRLEDLFDNDRLIGTVGYFNGEAAFLLVPCWVAIYLAGSRSVNPILRGALLAGTVLSVDLAVMTQSRGAMVAVAVSLPIFFVLSGQRLRGLLALVPIAAALYLAFPDLNGIYLAFVGREAPVEGLLSLVLPTVWLTAAGAGLYGLLWGFVDRWWSPSSLVVRFAGGLALVGCLLVLAVGAAVLIERTGDPVTLAQQKWEAFKNNDTSGQEDSRYLSASGSGRYTLWQVAWEDFETHPILGVGTQNYEATYYQLREQNAGFVRQPHMLPLEVLGERGIVGGALFFGFLAVCLVTGLRQRSKNLAPEGKAQVGALIAAIVYWFVHSSAEWFWQMPAVTLPAIVYLALLVSPWRPPWQRSEPEIEPSGRLFSWPLRVGSAGVAVLTVTAVVPLYVADHYLERSRAAADPAEGLEMVEIAQRFNPLDSRLPQLEAELAVETEDWSRAKNAYDRAIRLNPGHYAPYMFLATFYEQRGEPAKALSYYQKALIRNPLDGNLRYHIEELERSEVAKFNSP